MKKFPIAAMLVLACVTALAQQPADNTPATREDVQKYLEVMHARQMADAMSKPMHQMVHDTYVKDQDKLPPDFEAHMNKIMDDMLTTMPWGDMLDAMIPAYQKYLTRGDLNALVAFYSTPTGQKLIAATPAMTADAMGAVMPLMRKQVEQMTQRVQAETAELAKQSDGTHPAQK